MIRLICWEFPGFWYRYYDVIIYFKTYAGSAYLFFPVRFVYLIRFGQQVTGFIPSEKWNFQVQKKKKIRVKKEKIY